MLSPQYIAEDLQANWWLYLSMPLIASLIGYLTKLVAIRMMFRPLEFVGIRPWFGWQGVVPRRAATMASIACDLMLRRLLRPEDVFARLDPQRIAEEVRVPLLGAVDDITREVAATYQPGLWAALPEAARRRVVRRIQEQAPAWVEQTMADIKTNLRDVFDLKDMVVRGLVRDKALLNRVFLEAGEAEFRFIVHSGIVFGFLIGCVQAVVWALTHNMWVIPLFGLFIGWFTDWLALKLIFNPKKPVRFLGIIEWQGLFLRRRREVAARYGELVATEIITPDAIVDALLTGPQSERLFELVQERIQCALEEQAGPATPVVTLAMGRRRYREMKRTVAARVLDYLPGTLAWAQPYAQQAMDLKNVLVEKMQQLTDEEFESLLRPAFRQDEWILIAVGAALGFLVGELQVHLMVALAAPV